MPPESVHLPSVQPDATALPAVIPVVVPTGPDARVARPLLALTPSFAGGVSRFRRGGPDDRRFPTSVPRWICTNLIDTLDEG